MVSSIQESISKRLQRERTEAYNGLADLAFDLQTANFHQGDTLERIAELYLDDLTSLHQHGGYITLGSIQEMSNVFETEWIILRRLGGADWELAPLRPTKSVVVAYRYCSIQNANDPRYFYQYTPKGLGERMTSQE